MRKLALSLSLLALTLAPARAEIPPDTLSRILVTISKSLGQGGKVSTADGAVAAALQSQGALGASRVVYVSGEAELKAAVAKNQCVITNNPAFLKKGAVIAVTDPGDRRPKFVVSKENLLIFGINLPDNITRVATFE